MDWAEEKYSVKTRRRLGSACESFSERFRNASPSVCQQKRLIQEIKMVLRVLVLYIPLPMFWALFDQQVETSPLTFVFQFSVVCDYKGSTDYFFLF